MDTPTRWKQTERLEEVGRGCTEVVESDVGLPGPAED